jgi:hypothetical protein
MAKKTEAKRSYKLDIMTVLEAADRGKKDFYLNLTEEERKAFAPRVLIRWLSSVSDKSDLQQYSILAVNDLINLGMWSLNKHPELIWLLMTVAGTGRKQYHQWIPMSRSASSQPRLDSFIHSHWPHTNSVERDMLKKLKSPSDWLDMAASAGCSDQEIRELKDEFKKIRSNSSD